MIRRNVLGLLAGAALMTSMPAALSASSNPRLTLIIDDIGQTPERDRQVLALPGPVALAILPDTPHAREIDRAAYLAGKQVMLHMPMDPAGGRYAWLPGMPVSQLAERLHAALEVVPHAEGINNHMGSRMTSQREAMSWLMSELQKRHLFFVDSRTSAATVAAAEAQRIGLASLSRDVFLDDDPTPEAIRKQFEIGISLARKQGSVVMIGHPHPATIRVLQQQLPRLSERGIDWIRADMMIAARRNKAMPAHGRDGTYR
jgi:polysaccharide deacetylase 2 family uncharacterized protein YibQ